MRLTIGPRMVRLRNAILQTLMAARTNAAQQYIETLAKFTKEGRDAHGDLPAVVAAAAFGGRRQRRPFLLRSLNTGFSPRWRSHSRSAESAAGRRKQSRTAADAADATFWTTHLPATAAAPWPRRAVSPGPGPGVTPLGNRAIGLKTVRPKPCVPPHRNTRKAR